MLRLVLFTYLLFSFLISNGQKIDSVIIGSGGGVTGKTLIFKISDHYVIKSAGINTFSILGTCPLKKKEIKRVFALSNNVFNTTESFSHPYNTFKYVEIFTKKGSKKYAWGDPQFKNIEEVYNLYNYIYTISTNKFNK